MVSRWTGNAGARALALVLAGAGAGDVAAKTFRLSISASAEVHYDGRCTLTTASGEETLDVSGAGPRRESFEGEALACRLETDGPVAVEIGGDGNRSRSVTSRGTVSISVR